ncbi:MAG: hypothetical protein IT369_19795 [Candidatus Latescibacteria bacterium]|nr:hypothetical protein [Candidatus Latescibacterota bacterium]
MPGLPRRPLIPLLLTLGLALFAAGCRHAALAPEVPPMPTSPYAPWTRGPSTDPDYFPIGVWLQDPSNAARFKEAGINVYVGLWEGPTEEQLAGLQAAGMSVICAQNAVGLKHLADPTIIAWMHGDEPDNAQPAAGGGWGPAIPPATIIADYQRLAANDPSRPIWLNLGQAVANEEWIGRGAPWEDYPGYCQGTDILSFDVYPVAGIQKSDGENYLWYVAKGVDRLHQWSGGKTVWNVIETTRIQSKRKATPSQVRSEVWMSLIHGSRGILYFVHEWEPVFVEARLLQDPEMLAAVTAINQQIRDLAPVLNSATVERAQVVSSDPAVPVDLMAKEHGGDLYLFAAAMRPGSTQGAFQLSAIKGGKSAEVLGESRHIEIKDGSFTDAFADYAVHLYRIEGAAR